jgi:predicted Kef-type K+ transport protein
LLEVLIITFAFTFGLAVKQLGLPPLVGFLAAGFALNAWGPGLGLPSETGSILKYVAHLGVLLLLFTVGLKLRLRSLVQPEVVGGGLVHFAISCLVLTPAFLVLLGIDLRTALLLAIALAFSSTVLAAKVLEAKRELRAFHGRVTIGILIIQDLIALAVLSLFGDHNPSPFAIGLLALPLIRPLVHKLLDLSGHDELLVLMGMLLALVVGGMGFETLGLSSELGALAMGMLLADHKRTQELSNALWSLKEVFLVGFFLQIGLTGLPDVPSLLFALAMGVLLPLKGLLFFALLILFGLRARNAFLSALSLSCYSEFGLIVAATLLPEWIVPLAIAVAASFLVSAPLNRVSNRLFERYGTGLVRFERSERHPDDQPVSLGDAEILIMGLGRTGSAAYDFLANQESKIIALDADPAKVAAHARVGRNVLYADAEDPGFWSDVDISGLKGVVLAMNYHESKMFATRQLRKYGFTGPIIAHTMFAEEAEQIKAAGANEAYLTMSEAGVGVGQHLCEALGEERRLAS